MCQTTLARHLRRSGSSMASWRMALAHCSTSCVVTVYCVGRMAPSVEWTCFQIQSWRGLAIFCKTNCYVRAKAELLSLASIVKNPTFAVEHCRPLREGDENLVEIAFRLSHDAKEVTRRQVI